jgi:hypothetical protein
MNPPGASTITLLVLLPLIAWRVVARFRNMIGRQRLGRRRPWIQLAIFGLLLLLFAAAALAHPGRLAWLALGVAAGGALGVAGLRLTRFEATPEGFFYTPHTPLGIGLGLLFLGRIAWRLGQLALAGAGAPGSTADFAGSALTLAIFGLLAGYRVVYAIGLIRWRRSVKRARQQRKAAAAAARSGPAA